MKLPPDVFAAKLAEWQRLCQQRDTLAAQATSQDLPQIAELDRTIAAIFQELMAMNPTKAAQDRTDPLPRIYQEWRILWDKAGELDKAGADPADHALDVLALAALDGAMEQSQTKATTPEGRLAVLEWLRETGRQPGSFVFDLATGLTLDGAIAALRQQVSAGPDPQATRH